MFHFALDSSHLWTFSGRLTPMDSGGRPRRWGTGRGFTWLIAPGLPLANIGNASASESIRGVFNLKARRKPQAFAADAVSLWRLNQSRPVINNLAGSTKSR